MSTVKIGDLLVYNRTNHYEGVNACSPFEWIKIRSKDVCLVCNIEDSIYQSSKKMITLFVNSKIVRTAFCPKECLIQKDFVLIAQNDR